MLACEKTPTVLDHAYGAVGACAFRMWWLGARLCGAESEQLNARRGFVPATGQPLLWFHGASAGEMAAATNLAALLRAHGYRFTAAYTATNRAGVDFAARVAGSPSVAAFAPWDAPRWVGRALDAWRPQALFLIETELWPRLIFEACRRDVPVFCVSARIYPRDVPRYRAIRPLIASTLRRLTAVLAHDAAERERFISLGAPADRCTVGGNLKYLDANRPATCGPSLRSELAVAADEPVVVVGSVHADEARFVFEALERFHPVSIRIIVAPRHPSASTRIVKESRRRRWLTVQRSDGSTAAWRVLVLDTMGELSRAYAAASVAVVGGSFGRHGGHNLFEPVACGVPAIFGPHVEHFAPEARALRAAVPDAQVDTAAQLGQRLAQWLSDEGAVRRVLERQRRALPDAAAIAGRYVAALSPWLDASLRAPPASSAARVRD